MLEVFVFMIFKIGLLNNVVEIRFLNNIYDEVVFGYEYFFIMDIVFLGLVDDFKINFLFIFNLFVGVVLK